MIIPKGEFKVNSTNKYFSYRNKGLTKESNRNQLGEREVITLLTVLNIEDKPFGLVGKTIVDLGSGDQHLRKSLEDRGAEYKAIDIDNCNLEFDQIPLKDESIDIAIGLALIEHLRDPNHFLAEVQRILKKGGALWLDTPDIEACGTAFWNDPTHVHPYTRNSLRVLLEMNGFVEVIISPNYRCKPKNHYRETKLNFYKARKLMLFRGTSRLPVPDFFKGKCTGLFALSQKQPK
jgi:SAM-dependent methyltransferase